MGVFGDFNPIGEPKNAFLRLKEAIGDRGLWEGMSQIKPTGTASYQSQMLHQKKVNVTSGKLDDLVAPNLSQHGLQIVNPGSKSRQNLIIWWLQICVQNGLQIGPPGTHYCSLNSPQLREQ